MSSSSAQYSSQNAVPRAPRAPAKPASMQSSADPIETIKGIWANRLTASRADLDHASASWDLAVACVYVVFVVLMWVFFYKILFAAGKDCKALPWWGFGVFLFILCTISVLFSIAFMVTSSIRLSEAEQAKKAHKGK